MWQTLNSDLLLLTSRRRHYVQQLICDSICLLSAEHPDSFYEAFFSSLQRGESVESDALDSHGASLHLE